MMRVTGFLVGICLTVAVFLLVMHSTKQRTPTQTELSALVTAIAEQVDVVTSESEPDVPVPPGNESGNAEPGQQDSIVENTENGATQEPSEVTQAGHESEAMLPTDHLSGISEDPVQSDTDKDSGDTGLYLFWSPFRSTWAAEGFAGRLTVSTQVPVDVVTTAPGEHRVAFSYRDETERLTRIERIETITGLKLE
jgi:hypothetical protein